jgi:hypothetical protein
VHQPRLALTSTIELHPEGLATGVSNVTQTLGLRSAPGGDRLKVFATSLWQDVNTTAPIDPLAGLYEEATWDERLVATVYLLSPPDAAPGSEPDEKWVPYVKHELFWNLTYLAKNDLQSPQLDNAVGKLLAVVNVLGGGSGGLAVNFATASLNDLTQQALNLLSATSMAGTWWTSTGGGASSEFPVTESAQDAASAKFGWNKAARLQAQRIAAAKALKAARLDPAFPFRGVEFPISLLDR